MKWNESGALGHFCAHTGEIGPGEPRSWRCEMREVTLPSRHSIRNSNPGGLRPSTLPLGEVYTKWNKTKSAMDLHVWYNMNWMIIPAEMLIWNNLSLFIIISLEISIRKKICSVRGPTSDVRKSRVSLIAVDKYHMFSIEAERANYDIYDDFKLKKTLCPPWLITSISAL